jgi:hypothetical protein
MKGEKGMPFAFSRFCSRRLISSAASVAIVIAALSGCGGGSNGGNSTAPTGLIAPGTTPFNNTTRQASTSACTANPHVAGHARWTVLVYINGANNLQDDSSLNVGQMASVGSDGTNVNIIVQWKEATSQPYLTDLGISLPQGDTPAFDGTRRYLISPHTATDVSTIEAAGPGSTAPLDAARTGFPNGDRLPDPATNVVDSYGNGQSDMGSYLTLQDFVDWGAATYPADHLLVVIWDHGSAALTITDNIKTATKTTISKAVQTVKTLNSASNKSVANKQVTPSSRSVSFDANTGSQITTEQLPTAFASLGTTTTYGATQKCDVITVDCSLEGNTEVEYQLRNSARIYTGSEESPPGQGLAYDAWLSALKTGGANPCTVGSSIVSTFINSPLYAGQSQYQQSLTNSMVDLTQLQNVISALDALGSSLNTYYSNYAAPITNARNASQSYDSPYYTDYKDLYDYANNIRTASVPTALQTAALNLQTALASASSGAILASAHGNSSVQAYSTGLSIYVPVPADYDSDYTNLAITTAAPNWASFVENQTQ